MKKFSNIIKDNLFSILIVSIVAVVDAVITFFIPISVSFLLNSKFNTKTAFWLFVLVFISLFTSVVLTSLQQRFVCHFKYKLNLQLYEDLFHVKYSELSKNGASYYVEKILTAVNSYADLIMTTIPNFIQVWLVIIVSALIIGYISLPVLILVVIILGIQNIGYKYINKTLAKKCVRLQDVCAHAFTNVVSVFDKVDYIKQKSSCKGILKLIDEDVKETHRVTSEVNTFAGNTSHILSTFVMNVQYVTYIILAFMMLEENLSAAEFVLATMVVNICFSSVGELVGMNINMKDVNASWDFVENDLRKAKENTGLLEINKINQIRFENTNIAYDDKELVCSVNLVLKKGDIAYLKAETGTGKSSLVKSIIGFQSANGVYINDIPIEHVNISSLRRKVSYVSQQNSVINGKLRDNIFIGELEDEAVEKRISKMEFFKKFTEKGKFKELDITSSGSNLSGGDKQKIMISRLFVEDADVLILDEITSSMDEEATCAVFDEIIENFSDRIIIIISHNDSVQKYANRHLVIEEKCLKEF